MELDVFARQLHLLELLSGNANMTVARMCDELGISRRTFFRYITLFRRVGFTVYSTHEVFSIDLSSAFFSNMSERMRLSSDEVSTLASLLNKADASDSRIERLKQRLHSLYGVTFSEEQAHLDKLQVHNTRLLNTAIRQRLKVVLRDYESPHSHTCSDRTVEPYKFVTQTGGVRCYEPASDLCKTFKLSRMKSEVKLLEEKWTDRQKHTTYYTDIFGFSAETVKRVVLRLGTLSARILTEEFGVKETQFVFDSDNEHRIISLSVCSFQGVGRFVMGLLNDVEVLRSNEFKDYLRMEFQKAGLMIRPME